jgi:hypothetical protein
MDGTMRTTMRIKRQGRSGVLMGRALSLAALLGVAASVQAQQPATNGAPGSAGTETKISLDLRDVPFRTTIDALFGPTELQFAIEPTMPNIPITISLHDIAFSTALRTVLRLAGGTYRKDGSIYVLGPRLAESPFQPVANEINPGTVPASQLADQAWEKIPIQFQSAQILGMAFGAVALPTEDQLLNGGGGGLGGGYGTGVGGGGFGGGGFGGGGLGGGGFGGMGGGGYGGGFGGQGGGLGGGGYGGGLGGGALGGGGFGGGGFGGPLARGRGRF